MVCKTTPF